MKILGTTEYSDGIREDTRNLKVGKVVPVYKSGDQDVLNNYRPISVLPTVLNNYRPISVLPTVARVLDKIF